ncbi:MULTISPECIES: hypothetical protein [unclassified Holdemania]|uniref:hypothetical protein n=1 Tax=unclassified Holdemania TaxID=2637685 RepID=UPI000932637C|nr:MULTISPECIES: hypothetical protein [unclassified Holdemania]
MSKGRYEHKGRRRRRTFGSKSLALVLACVLLVGGVIGGTLAWLTADGGSVTNTFTESDIDIKLEETKPVDKTAPMVPGWTIEKDPKVTVEDGSEDCWLFVKITESTTPGLDAYISYAIAAGWEIVEPTNTSGTLATISTLADEIVIGRKVYKDDTIKEFSILGAGSYTDPMGDEDDFTITWGENQVCVKPSVTEQMMEAITGTGKTQPTLSFQAYAVQLFKTNSDGDKAKTADEFTAAEAWARAADMNTTP